jgi:hypothetical protein
MHRSRAGVLALMALAVAAGSRTHAWTMEREDDFPAFGLTGRAPDRPRLRLAFVNYTTLPAGMLAAVQRETAGLIGTLGVDADIRTQPLGSTLDPDGVTLILLDRTAPSRLASGVMGAVQRERTTRALWVYSATVAAGTRLGWGGRGRWSLVERESFARAMARVAVHEVVHLVCPWREHDPEGLMAGVLDHATLSGDPVPFARDLRRDFVLGVDSLAGAAFSVAREGSDPQH